MTARVAAGEVVGAIKTLGGVCRSDRCDHLAVEGGPAQRVLANAGPNAGFLCCTLCGGRVAS